MATSSILEKHVTAPHILRSHFNKQDSWKGYVSNTIPAGLTESELVGLADGPARAAVMI